MADQTGAPGADEKVCPFCAETIKRAAVKCRFCQSELPVDQQTGEPAPAPSRSDHDIAVADASRPAYDGHPDDDRGGGGTSWLRWAITGVLVFAVVVASVILVRQLMARDDPTTVPEGTTPLVAGAQIESEDAKRAAMLAATTSTESILSYSSASLDDDIEAAEALLAGEMVEQYASTMDALRDQTLEDEVTVEATVVAASTISATEHDARLLLFVNQNTTGQHLDQPRADLNRVVVTVHRDEGDWKVTRLDAL